MGTKPTEKIDWNPNSGDRQTPTGAKKLTGWLADERPPYQFFNWAWWVESLWQTFLAPAVRHNVIISDDVDERDYASLADYIADAPAAGDRILITNNQVIAAQIIIPSDITLCIQDGIKFTSAINLANSLIEFGSNVIIEGVLVLELSHAGTVDSGIELNGDGNNLDIVINNTGAGILTVGVLVNVAMIANLLGGEVKNTGAGSVTIVLNDLSLDESNIVEIRDSINNITVRSLGALSFLNGFTMDLGSDADGDIYYRDTGILKRLPKGGDGQILELVSGIPSWEIKPSGDEGHIILKEIQTSGTGGSNSTSGSFQTRAINTEEEDTGNNCSLAANQFTLDAGTYRIRADIPAWSRSHVAKLRNITDATDEIIGTNGFVTSGTGASDIFREVSVINGRFTIASAKVFEIQSRISLSITNGYGKALTYGVSEVYLQVELFKELD